MMVRLEQVAQRVHGCPVLGDIHGQVGLSSKQPDLDVDVPAHCRYPLKVHSSSNNSMILWNPFGNLLPLQY